MSNLRLDEIRSLIKEMNIEERDEAVATIMEDYVNGSHNASTFAEKVMRWHRYLQGEFYNLFYNVCLEWRKCEENGCYDGRNDFAVRSAKKITEL